MFNHESVYEPRASRITIAGRALPTELWMGGANSLYGEPILPDDLAGDWIIDLAGDMPAPHRAASALWLPRVFADIEGVPQGFDRLTALAESVAACLRGAAAVAGWEHPATPPRRLLVMCQQGMNRSGLVTGLILRALDLPAEEALAAIASRPGALTNRTYAGLVRTWSPSDFEKVRHET